MAGKAARSKTAVRVRRSRGDIREALLRSALVEFGEKGYQGASTRAIAERAEAHQPQINYHFESKQALFTAAVDYLFGLLGEAMAGVLEAPPAPLAVDEVALRFAEGIRAFVAFAAEHPELNQIMAHEGTAPSDRLAWMVDRHVRPLFEATVSSWDRLRQAGIAAPIAGELVYYMLIGAASLPYVNAAEFVLLCGQDPREASSVASHGEALVTMLLPGLAA